MAALRVASLALWVALGIGAAVLYVHAAYYYPFFSDDALISLRYAQRLSQGLGLTWTDGERVEGYTDLLWVLLNTPANWIGIDPMWSARALDFIGALAAIMAISWSPNQTREVAFARFASGGLILALSAPVAVWAIGGLEHGFMFGVLGWGLYLLMRSLEAKESSGHSWWATSACFGTLALLRADGIVLACGAALGCLLVRGVTRTAAKELALLMVVPFALLASQLAFRRFYYDEWVPNTAIAKVSFNLERLRVGFEHVSQGLSAAIVLWTLGLVAAGILFAQRSRVRVCVPLSVALVWTLYLLSVGGDIFPGWRQLGLTTVPLAFLIAEAAEVVLPRLGAFMRWTPLVWLVILFLHVGRQMQDSENKRAKSELWEWSGLPLGRLLKEVFGQHRPLLAVDAAGALAYWSELPALDMLGLNDRHIPRHPPPGFGRGAIGHELGDGAYVLRRSPDIVAFCGAVGNRAPCFPGGHQMVADLRFHRNYRLVRIEAPGGVRGELFIKHEGGPLGIRRTENEVRIPGYFFAGQGPALARRDTHGSLSAYLDTRTSGIDSLTLKPGSWRLDTEPHTPEVKIAWACDRQSAQRRKDSPGASLELTAAKEVSIAIESLAGELPLREVVLRRISDSPGDWICPPAASGPVLVSLADLADRRKENSFWARPGNLLFAQSGARVLLRAPAKPTHLEASADNNDRYRLTYYLGDTELGKNELLPRDNGGGMTVSELELPRSVRERGLDRVEIRAFDGDGSFSMGHLLLFTVHQ